MEFAGLALAGATWSQIALLTQPRPTPGRACGNRTALWGPTKAVLEWLVATLNLWHAVDVAVSRVSGNRFHASGWFGGYDSSFGNVTVGAVVPRHEAAHALWARIFRPAFYRLFIASYVICTLLPTGCSTTKTGAAPVKSFARHFKCSVYPHPCFEEWAYSLEGSPPC